jgi:capsular polysaccharide transport system permease protein
LARGHVQAQGGLFAFLRRIRMYLLLVILPTALVGSYLGFIASDQYVSEARFTVRSASQTGGASSILGAFLGGSAGTSLADNEAYSVGDYLQSHDAVNQLGQSVDLVSIFRRPEADPLFRLWWSNPTKERMLDYFKRMISISFDTQSNIAILRVYAFRRDDAQQIAEKLLELSEQRVNNFSKRAEDDTVSVAAHEVSSAETRVAKAEEDMTAFRIREQSIDPSKSVAALMTIVGSLEGQLAAASAEMTAQSSYLSPNSPQYQALNQRIDAIKKQIASETSALTGGGDKTMAPVLAQYERLSLEREFAAREYTTALASLENARLEAMKQHLFVARVVEPNLPDQSIYPRRLLTTFTVFLLLTVAFGIGWLIHAGTREHAA